MVKPHVQWKYESVGFVTKKQVPMWPPILFTLLPWHTTKYYLINKGTPQIKTSSQMMITINLKYSMCFAITSNFPSSPQRHVQLKTHLQVFTCLCLSQPNYCHPLQRKSSSTKLQVLSPINSLFIVSSILTLEPNVVTEPTHCYKFWNSTWTILIKNLSKE